MVSYIHLGTGYLEDDPRSRLPDFVITGEMLAGIAALLMED
jgi:hypothetical protein